MDHARPSPRHQWLTLAAFAAFLALPACIAFAGG